MIGQADYRDPADWQGMTVQRFLARGNWSGEMQPSPQQSEFPIPMAIALPTQREIAEIEPTPIELEPAIAWLQIGVREFLEQCNWQGYTPQHSPVASPKIPQPDCLSTLETWQHLPVQVFLNQIAWQGQHLTPVPQAAANGDATHAALSVPLSDTSVPLPGLSSQDLGAEETPAIVSLDWQRLSVQEFFGCHPWQGQRQIHPTFSDDFASPKENLGETPSLQWSVAQFLGQLPWESIPAIAALPPLSSLPKTLDSPTADLSLTDFSDLF